MYKHPFHGENKEEWLIQTHKMPAKPKTVFIKIKMRKSAVYMSTQPPTAAAHTA